MNRHPRKFDPDHLAFLRTLPCIVCLDNTATEAAHIRFADARICKPITGNSTKPDDRFALPQCSECHRWQHTVNERKYWEGHGIDPILIALALYAVSGDAEAAEQIIRAQHPVRNIMAAG